MRKLRPEQVQKVLIRSTNWVGDAVMSVPALMEIRRIFPKARISLLVRPWVQDVYAAVDFIDEILVYDKAGRHKGWTGMRRMAAIWHTMRYVARIPRCSQFQPVKLALKRARESSMALTGFTAGDIPRASVGCCCIAIITWRLIC